MIDFDGVDSFMSFTTNYKDTGLTGVYFSVSEEVDGAIFNMTKLITDAFKRLCVEVDEAMLTRAKRSLFTNILLMLDGSTPICEDIGRFEDYLSNFLIIFILDNYFVTVVEYLCLNSALE